MSTAQEAAGTEQPPRVRGPYRKGIARRRQLEDAAWTLFARHGYSRASLRDIADEVGVSPAGILRLFGSKEDLLIAVLNRWEAETEQLSQRVDLGAGAQYFGAFGALMRYHVQHPGLIELFLTLCTEATDPEHPASTWVRERYDRVVSVAADNLALLQQGAGVPVYTPERRELEVRWLFAAMDGLELQWIAEPALDLVAVSDALFEATTRRWLGRKRTVPSLVTPAALQLPPTSSSEHADGSAVPGASVRGPYRNGVERRRQIVAAATVVFGRRGYRGGSLREIADKVGVSAAALLRLFGSKEQLLFAVLEHWDGVAGGRTSMGEPPRGMAYVDSLRQVMDQHGEHPGLVELLLTLCTEASDPQHPAREWVRDRYRRIVAELDEALHQAGQDETLGVMDADSREFAARVLFAVMDGLELQWIADPSLDLGSTFSPFLDVCVRGWPHPSAS